MSPPIRTNKNGGIFENGNPLSLETEAILNHWYNHLKQNPKGKPVRCTNLADLAQVDKKTAMKFIRKQEPLRPKRFQPARQGIKAAVVKGAVVKAAVVKAAVVKAAVVKAAVVKAAVVKAAVVKAAVVKTAGAKRAVVKVASVKGTVIKGAVVKGAVIGGAGVEGAGNGAGGVRFVYFSSQLQRYIFTAQGQAPDNAIPLLLPSDFSQSPLDIKTFARQKLGLGSKDLKDVKPEHAIKLLEPMNCGFKRKPSKYYRSVFYRQIREAGCYIIDARSFDAPVRVSVSLPDGKTTDINVESAAHNKLLLKALVSLVEALPRQGNARRHRCEGGQMFALGKRTPTSEVYAPTTNPEIATKMSGFSRKAARQMRLSMRHAFDDIRINSSYHHTKEMGGLIGAGTAIYPTKNFASSAHIDPRDTSLTWCVWAHTGSAPDDWFFVFPDVSIGGSKGVAFKLAHGTMMSWDGRLVRHCTSISTSKGNRYSCGFVASGNEY
jgi:carnitine O-acetyltransferase